MRHWIFAALLFAAPALVDSAWAAPTCLDGKGLTIRCGVPGAMPVGWQPSEQQIAEWRRTRPPGPGANELFKLVLGLAAIFALIALMPEFDGARDDDWEP